MLPYIIVFIAAIGLTFVGQRFYQSNKHIGVGFFVMAILLLSFFAAFRDYNVGADVIPHKELYYDASLRYSSFWEYAALFKGEHLFQLLVYLSANVFGSMRVLLFILTFMPLTIIYYYGIKNNPRYMTLMLIVYLLTFFNTSLNVLRQVAAISCIIPAFFAIYNNKKLSGLLLILMATMFHMSAIFLLILFPICYFAKKKKQLKYQVLIVLFFLLLCLSLSFLSAHYDSLPSFIREYVGYIKSDKTNLNVLFFLIKIGLFGFVAYFYRFYKNDTLCKNYYYFALLDLLFYFFSNFVMFGYRLSYYFVIFYPFFIPAIAKKLQGKHRIFFCGIIIIILMIYWFDRNIVIGYDSTIPYILGGGI